jgi:putative DNA primase/helicase
MSATSLLPALEELSPGLQWVCFPKSKVPCNPRNGKPAESDYPTTWASYDLARKAWLANSGFYLGIGRMFLKEQGITGIDLDGCIDEHGEVALWAQRVVERLNSYTEISPSGRGLHIWVKGSIPKNLGPAKPKPDGYEMYDHLRYFTWTGKHLPGTPETIEERQEQLLALYNEIAAMRAAKKKRASSPIAGADTPYGLAALEAECSAMASTGEGARNDQLNTSAYNLGQLVGGGELSRGRVERELESAARRAGLSPFEIEKTLRSGLEDGMEKPRAAPPPDRNNGHNPTADSAPRSFNLTDLGNAERLVNRHGQDLRYCHGMKNFLVWNGTHWQEDKSGQAERFAKATVRSIYLEAAGAPDDKVKALAKHALASESKKRIHDMLILTQSEPGIPIKREELDASPWLLNFRNGTLDLRTGELYAHRRSDLLTRCLPIRYDPEAEAPMWIDFLTTIFHGDADLIEYIQRVVGYALTGDTSEQCFFLGYGKGNNGKSTFLETLYTVLGEYAQSAEFKAFLARDNEGVRNDIARMAGRRLVIAKEADRGRRFAESLMKSLTGGDTVTARFLYQDFFDFRPAFKVFLAVNHKPTIKGTDLGIWRRVRLIPFNVTIEESQKDRDLPRKLAAEAEGILAWAVDGCLSWQREGLGTPQAVEKATGAYRAEMDIIAQFLAQECSFAEGEKVETGILKARYEAWCDARGERYDAKSLRAALTEKGCISKRSTGGRYVWQGVRLQSETSEEKVNSEPQ